MNLVEICNEIKGTKKKNEMKKKNVDIRLNLIYPPILKTR